jgi:hypothetical protein
MARLTDEEIDALEAEARAILTRMETHQAELAQLGQDRRAVLKKMADAIGMAETARRLDITRQAVWNAINK